MTKQQRKTSRKSAASPTADGLAAVLSAVLAQESILHDAISRVEGKAAALMSVALAIVPTFSLGSLAATDNIWLQTAAASVAACLALSLVFGWLCLKDKEYFRVVVDIFQHQDLLQKPDETLIAQLVSDAQWAHIKNSATLEEKRRWFSRMMYMFVIAALTPLVPIAIALAALFR